MKIFEVESKNLISVLLIRQVEGNIGIVENLNVFLQGFYLFLNSLDVIFQCKIVLVNFLLVLVSLGRSCQYIHGIVQRVEHRLRGVVTTRVCLINFPLESETPGVAVLA